MFSRRFGFVFMAMLAATNAFAADIGTAFTYQGVLEYPPGQVVNDTCAFEFALCDDAVAACAPGTVSSHPAIEVAFGVFAVPDVDFGDDGCNGEARWMEIGVKCSGDPSFVTLSPRVELKPTPYSLRAGSGVGGPNALNVTPDGRVGIGTNAPAATLHVTGDVRVDGTLQAGSISTDSPLEIQTGGATRIFVDDATGAVGIGTSGPFVPGPGIVRLRDEILPFPRSEVGCSNDPTSDYIYCFGGRDYAGGFLDHIFRFDPQAGGVVVVPSGLPSPRAEFSCVPSTLTQKIYCLGGTNNGSYSNEIVSFEPLSGAIILQGAALPSPRSSISCATDRATGLIYCFGGYYSDVNGQHFLNQILEYDPAQDSVIIKSAILPSTLWGLACTSGPPGKVYCLGGYDQLANALSDQILEYVPATDTMNILPVTLPTRRALFSCAWDSHNVNCFGGYMGGNNVSDEIIQFDPSALMVQKTIVMPYQVQYASCVASENGPSYCFGGIRPALGPTDDIIEFRSGPIDSLLQVGNAGDGSGAMANAWGMFSSRAFKREIRSLMPSDYNDILGKIQATDVVRYRYSHDRRSIRHLGVIAEDSPQEILTPDGKAVSLGDYNAFLLAGIKALQQDSEKKAGEIENLKSEILELREAIKGVSAKQEESKDGRTAKRDGG